MSERIATIIDDALDEESLEDEIRDEIFSKLSNALLDEKRLLKRFYTFCEEYNEFEFDEMGINMEDADDIIRKTNKIRDKFLENIEENLGCSFEKIRTIIASRMLVTDMRIEKQRYTFTIKVLNDSFQLEFL